MTEFTPISSLAGGLTLGAGSALLLIGLGRIAGISGILGRALGLESGSEAIWHWAFLLGLPLGATLVASIQGPLAVELTIGRPALAVAGLLVGFGTQLGNGCTSGHGVCGLSRGSSRSLVATATFMLVAAATVYLVRHVFAGAA
jgi:uncharacterized membrane protein YedE/YeeE